jgi:tungstate transport system permease protein
MVGGNIVGQTRILTTAIALETSRGDFALAIALGVILLLIALIVNAALGMATPRGPLGS